MNISILNKPQLHRKLNYYQTNKKHRVKYQQIITKVKEKNTDVDLWRDTPVRYMGYSNEVGEAFNSFLPEWGVPASYGVAALYVMLDTLDKGKKSYDNEETNKMKQGLIVSLDTFSWQMLASVFWPGSFIRCVVNASTVAVTLTHAPDDLVKIISTMVGLCTIPFIVKPIDNTVDKAMEMSVTKLLHDDIKTSSELGVAVATICVCLAVPPVLFKVAEVIQLP